MYTIYKHIQTIVLFGATIYVIWTAHFESLLHICMSLYVFVVYVSIKLHELYHIISPWYPFFLWDWRVLPAIKRWNIHDPPGL